MILRPRLPPSSVRCCWHAPALNVWPWAARCLRWPEPLCWLPFHPLSPTWKSSSGFASACMEMKSIRQRFPGDCSQGIRNPLPLFGSGVWRIQFSTQEMLQAVGGLAPRAVGQLHDFTGLHVVRVAGGEDVIRLFPGFIQTRIVMNRHLPGAHDLESVALHDDRGIF
jgi:hypothetical protein